LLAVADLLSGKTVDFPRENVTFKKAPKAEKAEIENQKLPFWGSTQYGWSNWFGGTNQGMHAVLGTLHQGSWKNVQPSGSY
jgi:hypothetical protein